MTLSRDRDLLSIRLSGPLVRSSVRYTAWFQEFKAILVPLSGLDKVDKGRTSTLRVDGAILLGLYAAYVALAIAGLPS